MGLFDKKKREEPAQSCCEGAGCDGRANGEEAEAAVKVLGSGCEKCNELEANTRQALQRLGMDTAIEHVRDFAKIAAYGVMSTPALVVDGKVVSYGKVLKTEDVIKLLQKARG